MRAPNRDPAWITRLFWVAACLALLWPMLVATEFRPWTMFEPRSHQVTASFLRSFFPPELSADFLRMVMREAWRTVAIATAGMSLAFLFAAPLGLISTRVLSMSALSGKMATLPFMIRQVV